MGSFAQDARFLRREERNIPSPQDVGLWPLVKLAMELKKKKNRTRTDKGEKILKCFFGPYLQKIEAPGHLLTGVGKQLIAVCFLHLANPDLRVSSDVALWQQLKRMGTHTKAQSSTQGPQCKKPISMSTVYTAISAALLLLLAPNLGREMSAFNLLRLFLRLF